MDSRSAVCPAEEAPTLRGLLFPGHQVKLDSETPEWGGAWLYPARGGQAMAYDAALLEFAYNCLMRNPEFQLMLDIGASTGSFSLLPVFVPGLSCWSFEPQPGPFAVLERNLALNRLQDRSAAFNMGMSDKLGDIELYQHPQRYQSGLSSCKKRNGWDPISVRVTTLDRLGCTSVSFVKIDVEGWELRVLQGGRQFLKTVQPALLIEHKHAGIETITDYLAETGYSWLDLGNTRDLYAWRRPSHAPEVQ